MLTTLAMITAISQPASQQPLSRRERADRIGSDWNFQPFAVVASHSIVAVYSRGLFGSVTTTAAAAGQPKGIISVYQYDQ